jgi:hypothetical protein
MQVPEADLIVAVRGIRKLVVALDSIGFPLQDLLKDDELKKVIPKDLARKINSTASGIHTMLQKVEHSKRYKDAVFKLCNVSERRTFSLDDEDYNG